MLCAKLWAFHMLGLTLRRPTALAFDHNAVEMRDSFRLGLIVPAKVTWRGRICGGAGRGKWKDHDYDSDGRARIVWEETVLRLPGRIVQNPPASELLSREDWYLVKEDDGMLCLQRGDIGYLAFDRLDDMGH